MEPIEEEQEEQPITEQFYEHFQPLNNILFFLFSALTLRSYELIWLAERLHRFNRLCGREVVQQGYMVLLPMLLGGGWIMMAYDFERVWVKAAGAAFSLIYIMVVVKVLDALNDWFEEEYDWMIQYRMLWAVLFGAIYINYLIKDLEGHLYEIDRGG